MLSAWDGDNQHLAPTMWYGRALDPPGIHAHDLSGNRGIYQNVGTLPPNTSPDNQIRLRSRVEEVEDMGQRRGDWESTDKLDSVSPWVMFHQTSPTNTNSASASSGGAGRGDSHHGALWPHWIIPIKPFCSSTYILTLRINNEGLPWWLSGKESACQCRRHGSDSWSQKIPHDAWQLSLSVTTIEPLH